MKINIGTRYSSLELIPWWETSILQSAKALVIGAGALGNEVLKNLALLGLGNILIVDFDKIESSNLSRSVLYRNADVGKHKSQIAAERIKEINPELNVQYAKGDIKTCLGIGVFRRMDLIFGCVDNLEARVSINSMCNLANKPWFDAAIDILTGEVRTFLSDNETACFECGLEDEDYLTMNLRYSCARLLRESLSRGKQPTTPIIASIIAGMQVEQAIRYLHRFEIESGILHYNGFTGFLHRTSRSLRKDCPAHDRFDHIIECNDLSLSSSLQDLSDKAKAILGQETIVEFDREIVEYFLCVNCQNTISVLKPVKQILEDVSVCPNCHKRMRPKTFHKILGAEKFLTKILRDLELPPLHVFRAHNNVNQIFLEATGDFRDLFTKSEWHSSS